MRAYTLREIMAKELKTEWVWKPRIPKGYVTLLGAKGGTGKSGFALWLSNKLAGEGKSVLYVDAEHTLAHISERAQKWKLENIDSIHILAETDENGVTESGFSSYSEVATVAKECGAELIIIDSMTAVGAGKNMKEEKDAVLLMKELRHLARSVNGAVLMLCHSKKFVSPEDYILSVDSIVGSHAIADLARSVLLMFADPSDPSRKTMKHGKSNFGPLSPDLLFTLDEDGISEIREFKSDTQITCGDVGTKVGRLRNTALTMTREGKTKKEIRAALKEDGATEVDASRVVAWLREKYDIHFE